LYELRLRHSHIEPIETPMVWKINGWIVHIICGRHLLARRGNSFDG